MWLMSSLRSQEGFDPKYFLEVALVFCFLMLEK
ncbi:hypothetical protein OF001_U220032 [Pseudomonas sp. OF001]|nr:hypothetical protein OF001_U220032 [Pseudomonas sp. OF001]